MTGRKREFSTAAPMWVLRDGVYVAEPNTYGAVHGRRGTFVYRKCRCEPCTAAQRAYEVAHPRKVRRPFEMPAGTHGSVTGYIHWNCRCRPCTTAISTYRRAAKERKQKGI